MSRSSTLPASIQFDQLARDLNRMGPVQRRLLQAAFTRIGQSALSDARSRAGAWSSRIPAAISTRGITDTTRGRVGVELRVSVKQAPHARMYEGMGGNRKFRHPVFANPNKTRDEWTWTERNSNTRPFMSPAAQGRAPDTRRALEDTYEAAARECGFR